MMNFSIRNKNLNMLFWKLFYILDFSFFCLITLLDPTDWSKIASKSIRKKCLIIDTIQFLKALWILGALRSFFCQRNMTAGISKTIGSRQYEGKYRYITFNMKTESLNASEELYSRHLELIIRCKIEHHLHHNSHSHTGWSLWWGFCSFPMYITTTL